MKSIKWIAVFLALLVCLSGCAGTHQSGGSYNIYLIAKSSTTEFWKAVFSGANAAKSEYNVQLTILAPDTEEDFEVQNDYIRQAVADGADAIVFSAISYTENAAAIDEAVAAGVRVVVIDSDVDSKGVSVRIGTDNVAAGRMSGEAALKTAQEKIVVGIVNAYAETQNCREREQGFREVLLGDSRVKGIYAVNVSTDALEARLAAEKLLREHPEINVLIALNETTAVGAAQAVQQMQRADDLWLAAFDSNIETIDALQTGTVDTLIVQNTYGMGYFGVESAYKLLAGQGSSVEKSNITATRTITRENMFAMDKQKALFPFG